ncbi:hypothetical protein B0J11DRAFT_598206, partial [Dendryphion nanum]
PPKPLPPDIHSPPYVLFAVNGDTISHKLPPRISLSMVLHFAPSLVKWVLPPPESPSPFDTRLARHAPFVRINILEAIPPLGIKCILHKMVQASGQIHPSNVMTTPNIPLSVAILVTWRAFELPQQGIQALFTHLWTLMIIATITLEDVIAIWEYLPRDSSITEEMARNVVRFLDSYDLSPTIRCIQGWIVEREDRKAFFGLYERELKMSHPVSDLSIAGPLDTNRLKAEILERKQTVRVTTSERKNREKKDRLALSRRIRRLKSDDSLRSVVTAIHDPSEDTTDTPSEE